jgi:hypothetical protein
MDAALNALAAIEEIKRLKARFFLAVDGKDWAAYADLFTVDARFDVEGAFDDGDTGLAGGLSDAGAARGGTAMAAIVSAALDGIETQHIGFMPIIDMLSAGEARGIWPVEDWLWFPPGTEPGVLHGFGRYHEQYAKTAAGWRIARMRYERTRML